MTISLKPLLRLLAIPLIALSAAILWATPLNDRVDALMLRGLFALRGPLPPPEEVVIIWMDEDSYREFAIPFNQAWPRRLHVELLKRLQTYRPRAVAFDVLFAGPGGDSRTDMEFAETMASLPVIIGADVVKTVSGGHEKEELLAPYQLFAEQARTALVSLPEDYGVVFRFLAGRGKVGERLPSLAGAAVDRGETKPLSPSASDLISFYGPSGTIRSFSYYQVLDPEVPLPKRFFEDKIVFVGLKMRSALGSEGVDSFLTPVSREKLFGCEIHATAAGNLLTRSWIRRLEPLVELLVVAGYCVLAGSLVLFLTPIKGAALVLAGSTGLLALAVFGFQHRLFGGGLLPVLAVPLLLYLTSTLINYAAMKKAQRKTRRAFECYVAPEMVDKLVRESDGAPDLGGELVEGTAVFTDIAGFTTVSEKLSAREVSEMLNAYFTELMEVVFEHRGTLIKFIGDAAFVIWGAPVKIDDPAGAALKTALAIRERIAIFNSSGRFPPLPTRVGIHFGPMLVGNLGAKKRFDYTAVGDTINLASRVEGINKYFGTNIILTEDVKKNLRGGTDDLLLLGKIKVVGKTEPVALYAVFTTTVPEAARRLWLAALDAVAAKEWDKGSQLVGKAAKESELLQKAALFYLKQIQQMRVHELLPNWAGEIEFTSK